jgi:hypothetical protein
MTDRPSKARRELLTSSAFFVRRRPRTSRRRDNGAPNPDENNQNRVTQC